MTIDDLASHQDTPTERSAESFSTPSSGEEHVKQHPADKKRLENQQVSDAPPNGGYGWVCVVCAALINGHTWGINSVSLSKAIMLFLGNSASTIRFGACDNKVGLV